MWLFAIARNAMNDNLRAQWRRRWLSLEALRDRPSDDPLPEEIAAHNETRARLLLASGLSGASKSETSLG